MDREHTKEEEITINERPAYLLTAIAEGKPSFLIWTDQEERTFFQLMGDIEPETLIRIAESMKIQP